jgi:hypothetical protein
MPRDGDAELQDQPDATSVGQQCRLRERVTVHDQQAGELSLLEGSNVVAEVQGLRRRLRRHQSLVRVI